MLCKIIQELCRSILVKKLPEIDQVTEASKFEQRLAHQYFFVLIAFNFLRLDLFDSSFYFCDGNIIRGADIAQWIRLRLPFCHPEFESQAHHLRFKNICHWGLNQGEVFLIKVAYEAALQIINSSFTSK